MIFFCRFADDRNTTVCGLPNHHELGEGEAGGSGELGMRISARRAAHLHQQRQKHTEHVSFCKDNREENT